MCATINRKYKKLIKYIYIKKITSMLLKPIQKKWPRVYLIYNKLLTFPENGKFYFFFNIYIVFSSNFRFYRCMVPYLLVSNNRRYF